MSDTMQSPFSSVQPARPAPPAAETPPGPPASVVDQAAADDKAKHDAEVERLAALDAHPRTQLSKTLTAVSGQHADVRDHLIVLSRAVGLLLGHALAAAPPIPPDLEKPVEKTDGKV